MRKIALAALVCATLAAASVHAQGPSPERSPLDPGYWGVVYDVHGTRDVVLKADVPYLADARGTLTLDVYQPPGLKAGELRPAVIFLNAIGDRPGDKVKRWEIYRSWPRLVAAHGMVGISMDADGSRIQESIAAVFRFLGEHGAEHGVDASRLGVYAASANVRGASEYLLGGSAASGIRAAALYYGGPPEAAPRADLPVLFVVAESDAPNMREPLAALWQRVVETRAPWTLAFAARLPHAFDAFSDDDDSRRVIQQTIAFWRSHLEPVPAPPWQPRPERAIVAATYWNDPARTAPLLAEWVAGHPGDVDALVLYGRTLQQARRLDEAATMLERAAAARPNDPRVLVALGQVRFARQQWTEAVDLLGRGTAGGAGNSFTYGQLAYAQLALNRNEEAVRSYERAFAMGIPPGPATRGVAYYNLACAHARLGQKDKAIEALSRAVDEGFADRAGMEKDEDLAPLRSDPRFQQLLVRMGS
jgi:tetratricopeptide (TPR) repeat protein